MLKVPHDIIVDILSRLPVKNLVQLRCVCKSWRSLISDPNFAKFHLKHACENNQHKLLLSFSSYIQSLDYENGTVLDLDFPQKKRTCRFEVLGSCNGLICIGFGHTQLFLWNPSTRLYKRIPKPGLSQTGLVLIGFGYDSSVDDYKVVRAVDHGYNVEVYTLKSNSWRTIQGLNERIIVPESGVCVNGALHWLLKRGRGYDRVDVIISFDLAEEKFREMMPLPDSGNKFALNNLGLLGGCLCIYRCEYECDVEIWVMKEYSLNASWTKLTNIPWGTSPEFYDSSVPVCLSNNGEVLMLIDGTELVMYNPKERTSRRIFVPEILGWFGATVYVESLISPRAIGGMAMQQKAQRKLIKKEGCKEEASVSAEDLELLFSDEGLEFHI